MYSILCMLNQDATEAYKEFHTRSTKADKFLSSLPKCCTEIENKSTLELINLEFLSKVTSIGDNFLSDCFELKSLNLTALSKVTSIGHNFLSNCSKLNQ